MLDLCHFHRRNAPAHGETRETTTPERKSDAVGVSFADVNTYSKHVEDYEMCQPCILFAGDQVPIKVSKDTSGYLQVPVLRSRVPSYHMRELARGQFIVKSKDITLLDCIGEGLNQPASPTRGQCLYTCAS